MLGVVGDSISSCDCFNSLRKIWSSAENKGKKCWGVNKRRKEESVREKRG